MLSRGIEASRLASEPRDINVYLQPLSLHPDRLFSHPVPTSGGTSKQGFGLTFSARQHKKSRRYVCCYVPLSLGLGEVDAAQAWLVEDGPLSPASDDDMDADSNVNYYQGTSKRPHVHQKTHHVLHQLHQEHGP